MHTKTKTIQIGTLWEMYNINPKSLKLFIVWQWFNQFVWKVRFVEYASHKGKNLLKFNSTIIT
jgi:hypothetical protein